MERASPDAPVVTGIGAIVWVLPEEWQETEASLRRDLAEAGWSKAEIDRFVAKGDWALQVSVKQYADLSDGRRVLDPIYLGLEVFRHPELDEADRPERRRLELEAVYREEMLHPDDWDTLMHALGELGIEISYEQLLSLPLTVRLATPEDGPVPLPEM